MPNQHYAEAKQLRESICQKAAAVLPLLESLRGDMANLYKLLRWEDLDCSTEEYEALFDGFAYGFCEHDINYKSEVLAAFLRDMAELEKEHKD